MTGRTPDETGGRPGEEKYAAIRSYEVTEWSTHCEECGAEIDRGFRSATKAREAFDNLRASEGRALCDVCWVDPDEEAS